MFVVAWLEVHCWDAERLDENGLPEWLNTRNLQKVGDKPAWLAEAWHSVEVATREKHPLPRSVSERRGNESPEARA